ncbi:MAG: Bro-N domain-containing protein, partial [Synergistaceae bacterium]|nr:Bro-N domain-containing protein [Synergistaceae bacterium]
RTVEVNGEVWFVAKDVCDILEIQNVTQAVQNLDEDERSMHYIGRQGEANIISEAGLYKLIFNSRKPEAKEFTRWVTHEVLPTLHRTGTFSINQPQISLEELELRRNALNLERAKLINSMIENPSFPMTPETRTVFAHEVFKLASGHDYLAMLPECTEKWYTATEIGNELGISANKVGRIAKTHGIKAPDGESNEYGRWIFSKSQYSSREVPSFIYNENALDWFKDFIRETA